MFYDLNILCPKFRGKFATIWIAATRGIKYIPLQTLQSVNIPDVCKEIVQMIMSNSMTPDNRLSLKLAAQLTFGTIRVHRQHIIIYNQQIIQFMCVIRRPITFGIPELSLHDSYDDRKQKTNKKTKKKTSRISKPTNANEFIVEMPVVNLETLPVNPNTIDPVHITMTEDIGIRQLLGDYEPFGDEGQLNIQMSMLSGDLPWQNLIQAPDPSSILQPPEPPINNSEQFIIEAQVHAVQTPTKRHRTVIEQPHVTIDETILPAQPQRKKPRRKLPMQEHLDEIIQADVPLREETSVVISSTTQLPPALLGEETIIPPVVIAEEISERILEEPTVPEIPQEEPNVPAPKQRRRRIRSEHSELNERRIQELVYVKRGKDKKQTRCAKYFEELLNSSRTNGFFANHPGPAHEKENEGEEILQNIFAMLDYSENEDISMLMADIINKHSSAESALRLESITQSHSTSILQHGSIENIDPTLITIPKPTNILEENRMMSEIQDEIMPMIEPPALILTPQRFHHPVAQSTGISTLQVSTQDEVYVTPKKRKRFGTFGNIDNIISPVFHEPVNGHELPIRSEQQNGILKSVIQRYLELQTIIKNMFYENNNSKLMIEDVCFPINKVTIAIVFGDLLYLHSKRYITLISKPNSVELDGILPGQKMYSK